MMAPMIHHGWRLSADGFSSRLLGKGLLSSARRAGGSGFSGSRRRRGRDKRPAFGVPLMS